MTKFEQLDTMLEQGNGYITTRAVTAQGISKPYFAEYTRSRELERVRARRIPIARCMAG